MIALFATSMRDLKITKGTYKYITVVEDVAGGKFTSVILVGNWYESVDKQNAYEWLLTRQPELFK